MRAVNEFGGGSTNGVIDESLVDRELSERVVKSVDEWCVEYPQLGNAFYILRHSLHRHPLQLSNTPNDILSLPFTKFLSIHGPEINTRPKTTSSSMTLSRTNSASYSPPSDWPFNDLLGCVVGFAWRPR